MDSETVSKIAQLAKSLKEHHLAGTYEEAYARAKEIVLTTGGPFDKSVKEILQDADVDQEVHKVEKDFKKEIKEHHEEKEKTKEVKDDIKKEENILEDVEEVIELSEKVKD